MILAISSASDPLGLISKAKVETPLLVTAVNDSASIAAEETQKLQRVL